MNEWAVRARARLGNWRDRARGTAVATLRRVRPHASGLVCVLVAFCVGQVLTLMQAPHEVKYPDTGQYIAAAQRILGAHVVFDPYRTPGYPSFLAIIFAAAGGTHLQWVLVAQIGLLFVSVLQIYLLAYRLSSSRLIATVAGVVVAVNLYILQWERLILTEALAMFLLVTLLVALERHLHTGSRASLVACFGLTALLVLTRPNYLFLPLLLILVLGYQQIRSGARGQGRRPDAPTLRRTLPRLVLAGLAVYGLVFLVIVGNGLTYGMFGLSAVSNYSLLGKVLEAHIYQHMPLTGFDPRFAPLNAAVEQFSRTGDIQSWDWSAQYPQFSGHYGAEFGAYASQVLLHHPGDYAVRTLKDSVRMGIAMPTLWAPYSYLPGPLDLLLKVCRHLTVFAYWLLPVLLVIYGWRVWRQPRDTLALVTLAILLICAGNIAFGAATDFNEFDRLRAPLDWAMLMLATIGVLQAAPVALGRLRRLRAAPSQDVADGERDVALSRR